MGRQDFTQWQPSYSVGNWLLNNQHKLLLSLCKEAIECVPDDRQGFVGQFSMIRDQLLDCVAEHFRTEENLLTTCAYPLLGQHKEEHLVSQIKLTDFLMSPTLENSNRDEFHDFLSHWWLRHVLESDMQFAGAVNHIRRS